MAKAFQSLTRALSRLRLGNHSSSNSEMESETVPPSQPSSRRSEKRKIASPMPGESAGDRGQGGTAGQSVITDVLDAGLNEKERPDSGSKRRRTPEDDPPECASSTDDIHSHTYVFRVRRGSSAADGEVSSSSSLRTRSHSNECRLSCDMGDVWTQAYYEQPLDRHKQVSTGDDFTDRILPAIQYKGYIPQRKLASGHFSSLLLAVGVNRQHHRYVVLKFPTAPPRTQGILHPWQSETPEEVRLMRDLSHPNIVELVDFWPIHGRECLVIEYCENGNIQSLLEKRPAGFFTEPTCRRYFRDMFAGLEYLHLQCIVHRNLIPSHFLLDNKDTVKIADFRMAMSYKAGDEFRRDRPGDPAWHPPEYYHHSYNPRLADVWMLGLVLYTMLTGRLPIDQYGNKMTCRELKVFPFPDGSVLRLSRDVCALVQGMCTLLPDLRYSLARIRCSPWLQAPDSKVAIGNYHLARQPRKLKEGDREQQCKLELDV